MSLNYRASIASRKILLMRVCQPRPVERKCSSTSGSRRIVIAFLRISTSISGRPRIAFLKKSSSASSASPSSVMYDFCVILFPFSIVSFSQTNHANLISTPSPNQSVQAVIDQTKTKKSIFAVFPTFIFVRQSRVPIKVMNDLKSDLKEAS